MDEGIGIRDIMNRVEEPLPKIVQCEICEEVIEYRDDVKRQICDSCKQESKERQQKRKIREKAKRAFKQMIASSRPKSIDSPHISEVCAEVIKELGGVDLFAKELAEDYRDARERNPGSATVMRFGETVLRLVRDSTTNRESAPDLASMSDEDIATELMVVMDNLARKQKMEYAEDAIVALLEQDAEDSISGQ